MKAAGRTKIKQPKGQGTTHLKSRFRRRTSNLKRWAFIALGSNMGDRERILLEAMTQLQRNSDEILLRSSLWETAPVDCPPGSPPFLNAVVALGPRPNETPESLFAKLQALEKDFGRKPKTVLNEPRPLDLDLIAFGNETRSGKALTLPHARANLRRFVLEPMSEIASDFLLPGQSKTVSQLLRALPAETTMRKFKEIKYRGIVKRAL